MDIAAFFGGGGGIADLILAIMAAEFVLLSWRCPAVRRGEVVANLVLALGPGACLTLALRAALTGSPWPWVAGWVTLALPFHITDILRRGR